MLTRPLRELLLADVARRLRPVCDHLPEGEFQALISRIVDLKLRHLPSERDQARLHERLLDRASRR